MSDDRFNISRRTVLAGLGTVGLASAGAGFGTTAYFNDTESFTDNTLTAGELNLVIDYETSVDQGGVDTGSTTGSGQIDGANEYSYDINDVKPGDSGRLRFCPKIVDNPAYLWVASTELIDYENGVSEPESEVDETDAGTIGSPNDGAGEGELSQEILVTVSYEYPDESSRELNNEQPYTLADLHDDLSEGFLVEGSTEDPVYPASEDTETQNGPCIVIDWVLPAEVGNIVQTDGLSMSFAFTAEQARHNDNPSSPFASEIPDEQ